MAAKLLDLTDYRKNKQEERRLKSANEPSIHDPFGFMNPLSLYPFEDAMITGITEPTDSEGD